MKYNSDTNIFDKISGFQPDVLVSDEINQVEQVSERFQQTANDLVYSDGTSTGVGTREMDKHRQDNIAEILGNDDQVSESRVERSWSTMRASAKKRNLNLLNASFQPTNSSSKLHKASIKPDLEEVFPDAHTLDMGQANFRSCHLFISSYLISTMPVFINLLNDSIHLEDDHFVVEAPLGTDGSSEYIIPNKERFLARTKSFPWFVRLSVSSKGANLLESVYYQEMYGKVGKTGKVSETLSTLLHKDRVQCYILGPEEFCERSKESLGDNAYILYKGNHFYLLKYIAKNQNDDTMFYVYDSMGNNKWYDEKTLKTEYEGFYEFSFQV